MVTSHDHDTNEPDTPMGITLEDRPSEQEAAESNNSIERENSEGDNTPSNSLHSSSIPLDNSHWRRSEGNTIVDTNNDLQLDLVSEEEDFENTSQILFSQTQDQNNCNLMGNNFLESEYSDDEESGDESNATVPQHFRKSYALRNRPSQVAEDIILRKGQNQRKRIHPSQTLGDRNQSKLRF